MSYRTIQLHASKQYLKQIKEILDDPVVIDQWLLFENKERVYREILVRGSDTQKMMDKWLQNKKVKDLPVVGPKDKKSTKWSKFKYIIGLCLDLMRVFTIIFWNLLPKDIVMQ